MKANLGVAPPFDYHFYASNSLCRGRSGRIAADDPYFNHISEAWGEALKDALNSLPEYSDTLRYPTCSLRTTRVTDWVSAILALTR